jgi:hypothetical protein
LVLAESDPRDIGHVSFADEDTFRRYFRVFQEICVDGQRFTCLIIWLLCFFLTILLFNLELLDELRHPLTSEDQLLILIVWREI